MTHTRAVKLISTVLVKDIEAVGGIAVAARPDAQDRPAPTPERTSWLKLDVKILGPAFALTLVAGMSAYLSNRQLGTEELLFLLLVFCALVLGVRGLWRRLVEWTKEEHVSKRSAFFAIHVWYVAALLAQPLPMGAPAEVSKDAANAMEVICLTEQPAIVEGESATLKAWASTPDGQPINQRVTFQWQVTEGRITTQAAEARWDLSGVKVEPREGRKKLVATVRATEPGEG